MAVQNTCISCRKSPEPRVSAPLRLPCWFLGIAVTVVIACQPEVPAQPEAPTAAGAEGSLVKIDGTVDDSGHEYVWLVTNLHTSPIVCVEFPHHRADLFPAPPGWVGKSTGLVGQNPGSQPSEDPGSQPNVCIAKVKPPNAGIPRDGRQQFTMRIAPSGALKGRGNVKIRFADGTETTVTNVVVPVAPPSSRNLSLIGAALIFGGYVLVRTLRDRRRRRQQAAESDRTTET